MPRHDGSPTRAELKAERRAHCRSGRPERKGRQVSGPISLSRKQVFALSQNELLEILRNENTGKYTTDTEAWADLAFNGDE